MGAFTAPNDSYEYSNAGLLWSSVLGLSTVTPSFMQRRALSRHLQMLGDDDVLLMRELNGAHLTPSELRGVLFERGM